MADLQKTAQRQPRPTLPPKPPASALVTDGVWILAAQGNAFAVETAEGGDPQLAMHVIDLVALGPDKEPAVIRARSLKYDLCRARSKQIAPYPSKGPYKSSGIRLKQGIITWEGVIR